MPADTTELTYNRPAYCAAVGEIVLDLMKEGYVPSWCTACYRKGA